MDVELNVTVVNEMALIPAAIEMVDGSGQVNIREPELCRLLQCGIKV